MLAAVVIEPAARGESRGATDIVAFVGPLPGMCAVVVVEATGGSKHTSTVWPVARVDFGILFLFFFARHWVTAANCKKKGG